MDEGGGDVQWRQGRLAVGLPPAPVLAVTAIVFFFLYLTWQMEEYQEQLHRRTQAGFCVLMALGLVALAVLAHHALVDADGRVVVPVSWREQLDGAGEGGSAGTSPWAVAAVVALLLVLASHRSSFQMFKPPWYSK